MAKATGKKAAAPKKAAAKKAAAPAKKAAAAPKKAAAKKGVAAKAAPKKAAAKKVAAPYKQAVPKKAALKKAAPLTEETMLQNLFLDSLKDIYYAEKTGVKALPKLAKAATSEQLRGAFEQHAQQTNGQVQRLEQIFQQIGKKAQGKKCEAIEGLVREADSLIKETRKGSKTRDVALIMAVQKMEHYEIASYGSIATLAALMGQSQVKELLGQTLQEEKDTDEILTQLALNNINQEAQQEGRESEMSGGKSKGEDEKLDAEAGKDENTED
ncbi:MAG: ferritin-like domain-containing protein [Bacteroidota bacterium]|nr:ferritin-like domain-containing protein [Bacteroidota bacterium]